jgi:periplasmic nitrate reductase NapD
MEEHVTSLLVHARPAAIDSVREAILRLPGAEVPLADPSGKMVVIMETASQGEVADGLTRISLLDGVLSATLVYHFVDDSE